MGFSGSGVPEPAAAPNSMLLQQRCLPQAHSECLLFTSFVPDAGIPLQRCKSLAVSQRQRHPRQGQARGAGAEVVGTLGVRRAQGRP